MNDCPAEEMEAMPDDAGRRAAALRNAATAVRLAIGQARAISAESAEDLTDHLTTGGEPVEGVTAAQAAAFLIFRGKIEETM